MSLSLTFQELAFATQGQLNGSGSDFTNVCTDSRTIKKGDVFFALVGENFDGHKFIQSVIDSGASCVVVDRPVDADIPQCVVKDTTYALGLLAHFVRKKWAKPLVAITGSCGKTTVKGMVQSIYSTVGETLATVGNLNNHIGVPLTLLGLEHTHQFAIVEMGASAVGEIDYLSKLAGPNVGLINNVQPSHVEGFGSVDAIAIAKSEIYDHLGDSGVAVINVDDKYSSAWLEQNRHRRVIRFGLDSQNSDVYGKNLSIDAKGFCQFELVTPKDQKVVVLNVLGESNVMNALAAASCAFASGLSIDNIVEGLESFKAVPGRLCVKSGLNKSTIIDDTYNANPGSVKAAIDVLANYPGQRILVLGDMGELGDDSTSMHKDVGLYAQQKRIDCLFACGEQSVNTCEGFGDQTHYFKEKHSLVGSLKTKLATNTTVLVKGSRSAKMEEIVNQLVSGGTV